MGRGKLTETEVKLLRENPNVEAVNEHRIIYTEDFKKNFMVQYLKGCRPVDIFRAAGFDIKILGSKRIERACVRWKESYASGTLGLYGGVILDESVGEKAGGNREQDSRADGEAVRFHRGVREMRLMEQVEEQRRIIKKLQQENRNLRAANSRLKRSAKSAKIEKQDDIGK